MHEIRKRAVKMSTLSWNTLSLFNLWKTQKKGKISGFETIVNFGVKTTPEDQFGVNWAGQDVITLILETPNPPVWALQLHTSIFSLIVFIKDWMQLVEQAGNACINLLSCQPAVATELQKRRNYREKNVVASETAVWYFPPALCEIFVVFL